MAIKLTQGDTRPRIVLVLADEITNAPINLVGATVKMRFKEVGSATSKETLTGGLLAGKVLSDGSIDVNPPYDTAGAGGRCYIDWGITTLDTAGEFEGEIEVTFSDSKIQTVYDVIEFTVREQFV